MTRILFLAFLQNPMSYDDKSMPTINYYNFTVIVNGSPQVLSSVGAAVVPRDVVNVSKSKRKAHTSRKETDQSYLLT